jgi:phage terminase large subunit
VVKISLKNKQYIHLPDVVGKGYKAFWNFKGRYRVVKGSRRSKKSKTTGLWFIYNLMKPEYKDANLIVVRKTYRTLKDSCFTELKWAINRLQVRHMWDIKESPLEMTYLPTGQKIYFRGLDDPLKVTSITTEVGVLSWMWVEEAYEIMSEDDFDTLAESMWGDCPAGLFKQITLTFNPWNEHHWIKARFFDVNDPDILAITTNYLCNEWLSEADLNEFEKMKVRNPRRYRVAGLGEWGIVDGLIYENWKEQEFRLVTSEELKKLPIDERHDCVVRDKLKTRCGLDFGYTNDPTASPIMFLDSENKKLYIWDELYQKGLSNRKVFQELSAMGYGKERFTGDSAEPKSIDELKGLGLRIKGAKKGKDSVKNGIQWIQDLEIIVHPRCVNFLTEISNYTWNKDKFGKTLNTPIDDFNHLMDAMRYGLEDDITGNKWIY